MQVYWVHCQTAIKEYQYYEGCLFVRYFSSIFSNTEFGETLKSISFWLQVVFALNQTLNFQEKLRVGEAHLAYSTDDLIDHYNCGDLNSVLFSTQSTRLPSMSSNSSLRQLELKKTQEIDQYFRTELIFKRNERMAKRVIELLNKYPARNFFFAFGAGKFVFIVLPVWLRISAG